MTLLAVAAALALAVALGAGDAPNTTAALTALRIGTPRQVALVSVASHCAGGLLGGLAVARTIVGIVELPAADVAAAYAAASLASVAFMALCAWGGIPASASYGLIGGLVGAAVALDGWSAVRWGGLDGVRPVGVIGALAGLVLTPLLGLGAAALLRSGVDRLLRRATQRLRPASHAGVWVGAAAVGFAGGSNDGQKAMGLIAGALVASGSSLGPDEVPLWARVAVSVCLAGATVTIGRRMSTTVGSRLYRMGLVDGLSAQGSAALVIAASGVVGAPVSTSNVVTSAVIGVGADHRPRHVRWYRVLGLGGAWVLSVPVCALAGAASALALGAIGGS